MLNTNQNENSEKVITNIAIFLKLNPVSIARQLDFTFHVKCPKTAKNTHKQVSKLKTTIALSTLLDSKPTRLYVSFTGLVENKKGNQLRL